MTANSSHFHPEKWGYGTISPKNEGYRYPSYPKDCADEISSQVLDVDTCVLDSITASDDDALAAALRVNWSCSSVAEVYVISSAQSFGFNDVGLCPSS